MRSLFAALLLFTATRLAWAHSDPLGEVHPRVTANQDGSFTVTFRYFDPEREGRMRMMIGADGKELVPRHWIKRGEDNSHFEIEKFPGFEFVETGKEDVCTLLRKREGPGGLGKAVTRVLGMERPRYVSAAAEAAGKEVAMTFGDVSDFAEEEGRMPLNLTWCRSDGFQPGRTVTLGTVSCIYWFPTASPLVWSAGRWWTARVEPRGKEEATTWTTVLDSVDPESGQVEHHDLPGISNWNAHLDIAVNATGTICVAWHASLDGSYAARIVTAVFTPEK